MQKKISESSLGGTNCFNSAFFLSPKPGVGLRLTRPSSSSHGRREENAHFIFSTHVRILRKCFFQHTYNSCCWIFCSRSESVITNEFMQHTKLFSGATIYLHGLQVQLNIGTHWFNSFSFTTCYYLIVRCHHYCCIFHLQFYSISN